MKRLGQCTLLRGTVREIGTASVMRSGARIEWYGERKWTFVDVSLEGEQPTTLLGCDQNGKGSRYDFDNMGRT